MCPRGQRRLMDRLRNYSCDGHGASFELRSTPQDITCPDGSVKQCGPGWECFNENTGEVRETLDAIDAEQCTCPVGRRLLMNPQSYTCESHGEGFELQLIKFNHTCSNGSIVSCSGPGYECFNEGTGKTADALDSVASADAFDSKNSEAEKRLGKSKNEDDKTTIVIGGNKKVLSEDRFPCGEGYLIISKQWTWECLTKNTDITSFEQSLHSSSGAASLSAFLRMTAVLLVAFWVTA